MRTGASLLTPCYQGNALKSEVRQVPSRITNQFSHRRAGASGEEHFDRSRLVGSQPRDQFANRADGAPKQARLHRGNRRRAQRGRRRAEFRSLDLRQEIRESVEH